MSLKGNFWEMSNDNFLMYRY